MKTLELHYPMIQFLIKSVIPNGNDFEVSLLVSLWSLSLPLKLPSAEIITSGASPVQTGRNRKMISK